MTNGFGDRRSTVVPPGMEGLDPSVPTAKTMMGDDKVLVRTDAPPVRQPSLPPELMFGAEGDTPTLPGQRDEEPVPPLVVDTRISPESEAEARAAMLFVGGFAATLFVAVSIFFAAWLMQRPPTKAIQPEPGGQFVVERG